MKKLVSFYMNTQIDKFLVHPLTNATEIRQTVSLSPNVIKESVFVSMFVLYRNFAERYFLQLGSFVLKFQNRNGEYFKEKST